MQLSRAFLRHNILTCRYRVVGIPVELMDANRGQVPSGICNAVETMSWTRSLDRALDVLGYLEKHRQ